MQVAILNTILVNDTQFIDVLLVDGKKYTQLLHKTAEPNFFEVLFQEEGYTADKIVENYNNSLNKVVTE